MFHIDINHWMLSLFEYLCLHKSEPNSRTHCPLNILNYWHIYTDIAEM